MSTSSVFSGLPEETFFMVYSPQGGAPTARHRFREDAEAEAKRLARHNQGQCFVILEAVGAVIKREFDTVSFRAGTNVQVADDGIPF